MIDEKDKKVIIELAKQFEVREVYLFGSTVADWHNASDIDLAVRGIRPEHFFRFYGKLLRYLSKPVDLVNLAHNTKFTKLIEEDAVKIYG